MLKEATIITQCAWRRRVARRELRILKIAAKETGALQEAKSKLEQQVEELTWSLELEKKRRAELEEAKTQENEKLHSALQEMQLEFQETKALLIKEREAAKNISDHVPTIQDVPVADHETVNKLNAENEMLKDMVNSLERKIDETERKYEETSRLSEERLKQALAAETKIVELKTVVQRLEQKLAHLEAEDEARRRQMLSSASVRKMSEHLADTSEPLENGNHEPQSSAAKMLGSESARTLEKSRIERLHENVDSLIKSVEQNLGFSQGKPVAAVTVYRCLVYWKSFEAEKTSVFDRLIQMIGSAMENADDNDHMAYWLSNTSVLLCLLQRTLKGSQKPPIPTSFFGRMTQSFRTSPSSANLKVGRDTIQMVEARYPASLFKQQLTAYVETIYNILRENLKKDLSPLLSSCIQVPSASSDSNHWNNLVASLDGMLAKFKENFVPPVLVQKIFTQIFSHINVQFFNSFLLHRENCTYGHGKYVKAGLAELELWCQGKEEYVGSSWDELKHTRQAIRFLVITEKSIISSDEITSDLCPALSSQQLYKVCTLYWDDHNNTQNVSEEVLSSLKRPADELKDGKNKSILLNDDSSIPFSDEEVSRSLQDGDFSDVKFPPELLKNPDFHFLQE